MSIHLFTKKQQEQLRQNPHVKRRSQWNLKKLPPAKYRQQL